MRMIQTDGWPGDEKGGKRVAENPAPLLPEAAVQQARRLAPAIRNGQIAPLVGSGLSIPCGLPGWGELIDRLILAWKQWDPSSAARLLNDDPYIRLMRRTFKDDLALAGYLRRRIDEEHRLNPTVELQSFGELLYAALYPTLPETGPVFVPQPSHVHRHLVAGSSRPTRNGRRESQGGCSSLATSCVSHATIHCTTTGCLLTSDRRQMTMRGSSPCQLSIGQAVVYCSA